MIVLSQSDSMIPAGRVASLVSLPMIPGDRHDRQWETRRDKL